MSSGQQLWLACCFPADEAKVPRTSPAATLIHACTASGDTRCRSAQLRSCIFPASRCCGCVLAALHVACSCFKHVELWRGCLSESSDAHLAVLHTMHRPTPPRSGGRAFWHPTVAYAWICNESHHTPWWHIWPLCRRRSRTARTSRPRTAISEE